MADTKDLSPWDKARFGYFGEDGEFIPLGNNEDGPYGSNPRWVGGLHDAQLLRAFLADRESRGSAAAPAAPASPEARDALQASTGRVSEFEALMRLRWLKSLIETRQDANRYSYGRVDPETGAWEGPEWVDTVHEALDDLYSAAEASKGCRFQETWCSQCGTQFGPGDGGYGHCTDHAAMAASKEPQA